MRYRTIMQSFYLKLAFISLCCTIHAQKHIITQEAFEKTTAAIRIEKDIFSSLPNLRDGSAPIFKIHPPGTPVHGTVVILHGFGLNAASSAQQAQFLFNARFNVYAPNLPGFAQQAEHWPYTKLRTNDPETFQKVRSALLENKTISNAIRTIQQDQTFSLISVVKTINSKLMPIVFDIIRTKFNSQFADRIIQAFHLLSPFAKPDTPNFPKQLNQYFISEHLRYETLINKLATIQPLPGPIFAIGYSFGAPNVVNLAARSQVIQRIVLLAPFFFRQDETSDISHFTSVAGALDLYNYTFFGNNLPPPAATASNIAAQLVTRKSILHSARISTNTLCIIAQDDGSIDIKRSKNICRSKLAGRTLMYPKNLGLGHFITPELGNKHAQNMLQIIVDFFSTGQINGSLTSLRTL